MNRLYIRNVFGGKSLLDTSLNNLSYTLQQTNVGWKFTISLQDEQIAQEIITNKQDLNIFVVDQETEEKIWYYSQEGLVEYDPKQQILSIIADHKKEYLPE